MRISPLSLEWAQPESKQPVVMTTRFFIQRKYFAKAALRRESYHYWGDARLDVNIDGSASEDGAREHLARLIESEHYPKDTELRVIKRIVSIETTVCCGVEK